MDELSVKVLDRMRALCSRRECCCADILTKAASALVKAGIQPQNAALMSKSIIESLQEDKYLDDARYAKAFVSDKASISGWGPAKIRYALSMKKVDNAVINAALGEIDQVKADQRLYKLLKTKWKPLSKDPSGKMKLIRFALGRGYSYDVIRPIVEKMVHSEQEQ